MMETDLTKPTAPADNCEGTVSVALKAGTSFPLTESETLTWVYTDEAGNSSEQTQEVTIDDTMPPDVTGDLTEVTAQCPIMMETDLTKPTAPADNCEGTVTVVLKAGTSFPIEDSGTITWVYTDEDGNTSEQMQIVTITDCPSAPEENEPLGIGDDELEAVVFPNPSGRYVEVWSPVESPIRILSVGGELVLKSTTNTNGRLLKFVKR
ncbi:MAG: hypothetical protein GDA37_00905 [Ekhidna sp.]|nr:hypothetical protein [Ekhidna sp.]